ncbi:MAG TPA: DUF177 domain-containing protein [Pyrinomonadaceae bacterium]|jgi:uncharacterized protein|nr:DUF177 domain-containing protein [Pyrinomonadaceae bacterium]
MIVDLLSVTDEPLPFNFRIAPDEIGLDTEGVQIVGDVEIIGELSRNVAKTDVVGSVKAALEIECTRCLTPVKQALDLAFRVDFVDREMFPDSKETHLESSDLDTDVIEGSELDLMQIAREQILLNLPETVLCREDCKGICPTCGKDLNEGDCQCREDDIDPRWAALKNLK